VEISKPLNVSRSLACTFICVVFLAAALTGCTNYSSDAAAMLRAAEACDLPDIKRLHRRGISLEVSDDYGDRPLTACVCGADSENESIRVVKWLLSNGVETDFHDSLGGSPMSAAAERGYDDIVELLANHGANVNIRNPYSNNTPLLCAAQLNHDSTVSTLLKLGADPNLPGTDGCTPLHVAVRSTATMRLLLQHGADANARDDYGLSPLHWSLMIPKDARNVAEIGDRIRLLLTYGADPKQVFDSWWGTPDSYVGFHRHSSLSIPRPGESPLQMAKRLGYENVVSMLARGITGPQGIKGQSQNDGKSDERQGGENEGQHGEQHGERP
jgi:ankyrin repeat protein